MKELLDFIVKGITLNPEVTNVEAVEVNGIVELRVKVVDSDFGTLIGKGGRTIKSIRDLLRLKGQRDGLQFSLVLEEPEKKIG